MASATRVTELQPGQAVLEDLLEGARRLTAFAAPATRG
jgi:hypothetical protein